MEDNIMVVEDDKRLNDGICLALKEDSQIGRASCRERV